MTSARLTSIYRYPVKGLSPERLARVSLSPGQTLPSDRRYAIENGPIGFDPAAPKYFPKTRFLMLMRHERLATLDTRFDEATATLTIAQGGRERARGNLESAEGRAAIENFFSENFTDELNGARPRVLAAPGFSFSDVAKKVVSIINLASVADLAATIGKPVDPLRFRGNLYVEGWPAWSELELLGQTLAIGKTRVHAAKRIVRCAATNVDPATGSRDLNIPQALQQIYGHADCGIYAEVVTGGAIAAGDEVRIL